jgi:hypothetical protein
MVVISDWCDIYIIVIIMQSPHLSPISTIVIIHSVLNFKDQFKIVFKLNKFEIQKVSISKPHKNPLELVAMTLSIVASKQLL